jgi:RNA polymerase sigma factor (sigma-70 family)
MTGPYETLFRREWGRLVAALTRLFGVHNLSLAEDVAQDAFCRAIEAWGEAGPPPNPQAWLMQTAKNRALDLLRRQRTASAFAPELSWLLQTEWTLAPTVEDHFAPGALKDDLLRMMFSCCDPRLAQESQVALILQILCGFSIPEVAAAFMSGQAAMAKRLVRAKKTLASAPGLFDVAAVADVATRLPAVQQALYLLFNEGYHGASAKAAVRTELCREAMRLAAVLLDDDRCATPASHALGALMCLHAARLPARLDPAGDLVTLAEQDRALWDPNLAADGLLLLERAAAGDTLTDYHLEAAIAATHAVAPSAAATDWAAIVGLYDALMALRPSPVVALNRAVAIAERDGAATGLAELAAIEGSERLAAYPLYHAAFGELARRAGDPAAAADHLRRALATARNPTERRFLQGRLVLIA